MIRAIKFETATARASLIVVGFVCFIAFLFFAKWCFANAIATRSIDPEVAKLAVSLAPDDPQTHYAWAVLNEKIFLADNLLKSLVAYERTVTLAPNDFRVWLAFASARERMGDPAGAELAARKALALAPHYAQVQWTLGNILLRRGKTEEAFSEIRRAAESNATYRMPAITTVWQVFDGNLVEIKQFIGDSSNLSVGLMVFLAEQKRFEEALEIWMTLSPGDKKSTYKSEGEQLFGKLIAAKKYRNALLVQQDISDKTNTERLGLGKIYNGGFETDIEREKAGIFDWQIADGLQPQIGLSAEQKHEGNRSIMIIFNSSDGKDFRSFSQIVAVEPAKKYIFNGFYKSNLKTAATLFWEFIDASDGKVLASTKPLAVNSDWTELKMEFTTPENTEGVALRLMREPCKSIVCPITGNVWFDDFSISQ